MDSEITQEGAGREHCQKHDQYLLAIRALGEEEHLLIPLPFALPLVPGSNQSLRIGPTDLLVLPFDLGDSAGCHDIDPAIGGVIGLLRICKWMSHLPHTDEFERKSASQMNLIVGREVRSRNRSRFARGLLSQWIRGTLES
ncbi:hypothetical protein QSJ18_03675 [Gordonia sp. ABSL1-1]|nr:hypothetical protein [Gordonia sp. ABSL1-1]MDL9935838.1 hypothetical protein [Gordonia sp. ABSL1-1]